MNEKFINVLRTHIERHPCAEVVDVYKLLYQAANGPKHLLLSGLDYGELEQKWESAENTDELPLEPISVDGELVRAHFAPLREQNVRFHDIWSALLLTAESLKPRPELLIEWWRDLGDLIQAKMLNLKIEQYHRLNDEFERWGFVPKHHSQTFSEKYKPAYIVALRRFLPKITKEK